MGREVANVGFVATTSGQTSIVGRNLDDGDVIAVWMPTTVSTGISYTIDVSPSSTGTDFHVLAINPASTGAQAQVVITSSARSHWQQWPVAFRQIRITATAAETTFASWRITKQIDV